MVTRDEVLHIAKLSKITIPEDKIEKFQKDMSNIVDFFGVLSEAKTDGVPETSQVTGMHNISRPDEIEMCDYEKELVECTPHKVENNSVKIPKIM